MTWKAPRPAIEIAFETFAIASLCGAVAFAVLRLIPAGSTAAGLALATTAGVIAGGLAMLVMARVDRRAPETMAFDLPMPDAQRIDPPAEETAGPDGDDVLLLEAPIVAEASASRVVQLFAAGPPGVAAEADMPDPGEMIARIEQFLRPAGGTGAEPGSGAARPVPPGEANAALHAALADIRRSLRQA